MATSFGESETAVRYKLLFSMAALLSMGTSGEAEVPAADLDLGQLVKSAEERAAVMKEEILGIEAMPLERSRQYQREAIDLAQGNRDRLRKGLSYLGKGYNVDFFDNEPDVGAGVIYVAVSLAMPRDSLRQLLADAQKAGAVLVIRGFVDGSFRKTQRLILSTFGQGEDGGILIDPRVFQQYGIDRVPAFIAAPVPVESCEDGGLQCERTAVPFDVVKGNISLAAALGLLAEKGDVAPSAARDALTRLERFQ